MAIHAKSNVFLWLYRKKKKIKAQNCFKTQGEPTEKVDDDDIHKSDDKVVSLGHDDEPVEEHAQGVDQSISEVNCL